MALDVVGIDGIH